MGPSRFRDRFYTRPVARAMTSPLGIVLAGAGAAAGIAIGLPIIAAAGIGVAAWAARVAAAIPKGFDADGIDPFDLQDPWRTFVWQAKRARRHFNEAVRQSKEGPLRDRLGEIGDRVTTGVEECWRVARSGQALTDARARIDVASITKQLTDLTYGAGAQQAADPTSALGQTVEALQSQLATAKRLDEVIADTRDRLRLLDARLDEAVTRAIELAARVHETDDLTGLSADVESVVGEMESLRVALTETDELSSSQGSSGAPPAGATATGAGPGPTTTAPASGPATLPPGAPASPLLPPTPASAPQPQPQPVAQPQPAPAPQPQPQPRPAPGAGPGGGGPGTP
ncbi:MAG: hypothetical protein R2726_17940 [Acidimicrobiales bacterium]